MQPSNLQLGATICHLQLCFVIFTINHHSFQSITIIVMMVQLIQAGRARDETFIAV